MVARPLTVWMTEPVVACRRLNCVSLDGAHCRRPQSPRGQQTAPGSALSVWNMRYGYNSATGRALRNVAGLFCFVATAAAAAPDSPLSSTNIFAPASTPAKTIFDLSMFVLAVTAVIFVVVGTSAGLRRREVPRPRRPTRTASRRRSTAAPRSNWPGRSSRS